MVSNFSKLFESVNTILSQGPLRGPLDALAQALYSILSDLQPHLASLSEEVCRRRFALLVFSCDSRSICDNVRRLVGRSVGQLVGLSASLCWI